eukprot:maker-scaffold395_size185061-snap-gene-0.28 protein:Tk08338 transcript:maker-scaffold395_size185061-snap-gene-0.28-mRNA-1 annotation:"PREDICTED: uncharacterized protein LOC102161799"
MALVNVNPEVRSGLSGVLLNLLSPNLGERQLAEQQLQALQVTEEYGVILAEITLAPDGSLPLRQMTAVLLKQYVDTHWSEHADKFVPPEASPAAKETIRRILPAGLNESIIKKMCWVKKAMVYDTKQLLEAGDSLERKPGSGGHNLKMTDNFLADLAAKIDADPTRSI